MICLMLGGGVAMRAKECAFHLHTHLQRSEEDVGWFPLLLFA